MRNLALDIANQKIEEKVEEEEPQPVDGLEEVVFFLSESVLILFYTSQGKKLKMKKAEAKKVTETEKNRAKKVIKLLSTE